MKRTTSANVRALRPDVDHGNYRTVVGLRARRPAAPAVPAPAEKPAPAAKAKKKAPARRKAKAPKAKATARDWRGIAERSLVGAFHLVTYYGVISWLLTVAPLPVAVVVSTLVVGTVFLLLDGLFHHANARRWAAIVLLSLVGVYGSAATWRHDLAGEGADSLRAREAHAQLEARIYRPLVAVADATDADADAAEAAYTNEVRDRGGRGPVARGLEADALKLRAAADKAERARDALAPYFGAPVDNLDAAQLHAAAVAAAGVAGVESPARGAYVEPELLVPALRAIEGEPAACVGFAMALGVDFVGIVLLGTAIRHRRRR